MQNDDPDLWARFSNTVTPLARQTRNMLHKNPVSFDTAKKQRMRAPYISLNPLPHSGKKCASPLPPPSHALDRNEIRRIKQGRIPLATRLDLHGMTQAKAHKLLINTLTHAHKGGEKWALVITGKGKAGEGILRKQLPHWLTVPPLASMVIGYKQAADRHGGAGAFYVRLRKTKKD